MANELIFDADPDSPFAVGPSQWDWFGIQPTGPVKETFGSYVASAPPRSGWFPHPGTQQLFFAQNGILEHVAGQEDRTGNDDGPGATAKLGMGGLAAGAGAAGPNSEFYLSCQGYDCIKKITRNPNRVETFATGVSANMVACTATSLWTASYDWITERSLATGAVIGQYPLQNLGNDWLGGWIVAGGLWLYCWEGGPATVLWRFDLTTHAFEHKAGRRFAQWNDPGPDDGPVREARLYKCSPAWFSPDGQQWRFTGGDSYFEILVDLAANQTTTRLNNGTLAPLVKRQGVAATIFVAGMDGDLPITYSYPWPPYPKGLPNGRFYGKPRLIQVPDPGAQMEGSFDLITPEHKAFGWARDVNNPAAHVAVQLYIDGLFVAETVADLPSTDVGNHRFLWPIPAQYHDGQEHLIKAMAGAFLLWGENPKTFQIQGGDMTKTLSWQTNMQNIPGGDHYKVTINGVAQPPVPYDATEVVLEVNAGDVIEAQTADAADNWLAAPQSVTVPGEPGSKIIISLQLS